MLYPITNGSFLANSADAALATGSAAAAVNAVAKKASRMDGVTSFPPHGWAVALFSCGACCPGNDRFGYLIRAQRKSDKIIILDTSLSSRRWAPVMARSVLPIHVKNSGPNHLERQPHQNVAYRRGDVDSLWTFGDCSGVPLRDSMAKERFGKSSESGGKSNGQRSNPERPGKSQISACSSQARLMLLACGELVAEVVIAGVNA